MQLTKVVLLSLISVAISLPHQPQQPRVLQQQQQQQQREDITHIPSTHAKDSTILNAWLQSHKLSEISESDSIPIVVSKIAKAAKVFAGEELGKLGVKQENLEENEYPFFQFIPILAGKVRPGGAEVSWEGRCFAQSSAQLSNTTTNSFKLTITLEKAKDLECSDSFLLATVERFSVHSFLTHGKKEVSWELKDVSEGDLWDFQNNGIRIFMFLDNMESTLASITETALLYEPLATKAVGKDASERNVKFLANYANVKMEKRTTTDVILDQSLINSGDFFGVIRLDGLDPMLGWAMGSTTGHTTVALRDGDDLFVCESTATTSYWDVNGIQCAPYSDWIAKAKSASFQVVHIPLAPKYRALFNETAAWEFFHSVSGLDYGYTNMFYGWIDTLVDNYPCAPPNFERCLSWDIVEVLFPLASQHIKQFTSFWDQAFNFRLGSRGLGFSDLLKRAHDQNIPPNSIPAMVEDDAWVYNNTKNGTASSGPSMVCCVFVCHIWKASGMFGELADEINCGELTNWDDYSMLVFDPNYQRPQMCVDADPNNQVCQLLGEYTLQLNNYNTKAPFAHIAEKCPSLAPNYTKPADC